VLNALKAGQMEFAIDQQPYLQGYLPVMMLAQNKRFGLFPDQGEVVFTGPHFVTKDTAEKALALSRRGIR
jgi:simple sugar transport system substrate-binding protein